VQHVKSIIQAPYQNAAVVSDRYKLVSHPKTANRARFSVDHDELDLFDLISDPSESRNLVRSKPIIVRTLKRHYESWYADVEESRDFQPGRISIGSEFENPSQLCRYQDGHYPYGTDLPIGWPVTIEQAGAYRIRLVLGADVDGVMGVNWREETWKGDFVKGNSTLELSLETGCWTYGTKIRRVPGFQ
jgi:hypothetical protein